MTSKITAITIQREIMAYTRGAYNNTAIWIHRGNKLDRHETNPMLEVGKISNASVIRAKRVMNVILERAAERMSD